MVQQTGTYVIRWAREERGMAEWFLLQEIHGSLLL
jgi:hypothetical protein